MSALYRKHNFINIPNGIDTKYFSPLSDVEKEIFYESIKDLTANLNMNRKCAILTDNPQEVVISELFKLRMNQSSLMNIKIFSTETAALEWINM